MKILTLTLNPAIDVHCTLASFRAEHENIADVTDREAGGKGVNISRALQVLGVPNTALLLTGEENAASFVQTLTDFGLDVAEIRLPGRIRENITIHPQDAPETRLSFTGFAVDAAVSARVAAYVRDNIGAGDVLTVTGSLPRGMHKEDVTAIMTEARDRGARVVLDSRSFTTQDMLSIRPWLVKPNEDELAAFCGLSAITDADVRRVAQDWQAQGIENVMVSLGARGAVLACADGYFTVPAPKINPLSTIGAGDSSLAGFIAAFAAGKSAQGCLRSAVAVGSAACLTPGTQPPRKADAVRFGA